MTTQDQRREYGRKHYQKNKQKYIDRAEQWARDNPEKRKAIKAKWRKNNPDTDARCNRSWRERNPELCKKYDRAFKKRHHRKLMVKMNERYKVRRKTDPNFRILSYLRSRVRKVLRGNRKYAHTRTLLGCSLHDFITYLESKFEPGMTLENYGKVWHVDHIMPCAIFDMSKQEHQRRCFHFSNLQPLFVADNLKKSDSVTTNQFNLL